MTIFVGKNFRFQYKMSKKKAEIYSKGRKVWSSLKINMPTRRAMRHFLSLELYGIAKFHQNKEFKSYKVVTTLSETYCRYSIQTRAKET